MSKHRAPRRLGRRAATPVAALALSAAALTAVAPMASAHTSTKHHDWNDDDGDVGVLNHSTVLPVQACGTQVPILSGILGGNSDHASCAQSDTNSDD
ncbi:hypothetical protein LQ327_08520 [Actinomycetospora endophytica]|uniref:Small secreted domain DUF320 n=1 Tax=Actinomycetospora endophytica TaxID=2291215 RepID=A0ABS8P599_9PSEU|nr:hypothetical protein [Actinomycetospora endophytica]MCD2193427.1 hypothetical protein [Actinomycetospora endophytica]